MSILLNRVRQQISSPTGTGGPLVLASVAYSNLYQTIAGAGGADQDELCYIIEEGQDWEIQRGIWTAGSNSLARNTPIMSSIAGAVGTSKLSLAGSATIRVIMDADEVSTFRTVRTVTAATDTIVDRHKGSMTLFNRATAIAVSLAAPSGNNFKSNWHSYYKNIGVGDVTITATGATITSDGVSSSAFTLKQYEQAILFSDGTNYYAIVTRQALWAMSTSTLTSAQKTAARAALSVPHIYGQCRLVKSGSNLVLQPFGGNVLTVNGEPCTVPDSGVSLAPTALTPGTLYYIYATASAGAVTTLEASTTTHATSSASGNKGNEIKNGDETRTLVGVARIVTGPAWADSASQRFVRSWHNRSRVSVEGALDTSSTESTSGFVEKTVSKAEFVCFAGEAVLIGAYGMMTNNSAPFVGLQLFFDGGAIGPGLDWNINSSGNRTTYNASYPVTAGTDGYHYAAFGLRSVGGGTTTLATYAGMLATALVG